MRVLRAGRPPASGDAYLGVMQALAQLLDIRHVTRYI